MPVTEVHTAIGQPERTTGEVAGLFGVQAWQVARVFERGLVPEPRRSGGRRMIPPALLPEIIAQLDRCGWLPKED